MTIASSTVGLIRAGNLNPPAGPPAPTMKTLTQVEPRTPIEVLPYTISQPGSYYLTQNLTASGGGGIAIQASDVTLDLNGFTLDGGLPGQVAICECAPAPLTNWVIRNGTLRNWFSGGVSATNVDGVRIEGLTLINSGLLGLALGDHARVTDTLVEIQGGTSSDGIFVLRQSTIERCTVSGLPSSTSRGIVTGPNSIVTLCNIESFASGVVAGAGTNVSHCTISSVGCAGAAGIILNGNSVVEGNSISGVGCSIYDGSSNFGIKMASGQSNVIDGNHFRLVITGIDLSGSNYNVVFHNSMLGVFNWTSGGNPQDRVAPFEHVDISLNPWANIIN